MSAPAVGRDGNYIADGRGPGQQSRQRAGKGTGQNTSVPMGLCIQQFWRDREPAPDTPRCARRPAREHRGSAQAFYVRYIHVPLLVWFLHASLFFQDHARVDDPFKAVFSSLGGWTALVLLASQSFSFIA